MLMTAFQIQGRKLDEVNVTEPRTSTDATLLETQLNDHANKSIGQMESLHDEEMSSDDVAKRKIHFFSSQCFLENDCPMANSFTEQNLCVKCNKDGQLLGCNASSCPLMVHENCLGCPANFDETGNFYCPLCAYSLAISECLEAKKKASIARKRLTSFFQKSLEQHPNESAELHKKEQTHSRQNGKKEIYDNHCLGGRKHNQVGQNGQNVHDFSDHLCQESISNRNKSEPSASCFKNNLPCREEMANLASATFCVSNRGEAGKKNLVNKRPSGGALEQKLDQAPIKNGEYDKFNISRYSMRPRRQERHYTYPAIPQLRRKRVPWTAKEEEMLKKGMRIFTTGVDDGNIPWKLILVLGGSVFLGRTAVDLKDKWRNMCKGGPRAK